MRTALRLSFARGALCLMGFLAVASVKAQGETTYLFDLPAQPLADALRAVAHQTGANVLFESQDLKGIKATALHGQLTATEAVNRLLAGTKLEVERTTPTTVIIRRPSGMKQQTSKPLSDERSNAQARAEQAGAPGVGSASVNPIELGPATAIEEIIVTAQHRAEKLRDVPMGVTALSGDTLDKLQDRGFEDYAARVPGMSITQQSRGFTTLTLRGVNAGGTGSTVSVYVDDSPVGSSSALAGGDTFAANFDPWDMQRIEVLRGPQGTLYGASSEGGLIRFVTNAPDPTAFAGLAEVGGEGITQGGKGWSGKLMLNVPLTSSAAFRLSGYSESLPGYIGNPLLHMSDIDSGKKNGLRASLLLLPTSDVTIRLTAFRQEIRLDGNPIVDVDNTTRQPLYGPFTQERVIPEPTRFTYDHYNARVDWNLGWASALSSTTYGKSNNQAFRDYSLSGAAPGVSISQAFSQGLGASVGVSVLNQPDVKKFTQELRLQSSSDARLQWEVGGYFTRETAEVYQPTNIFYLSNGAFYGGKPAALSLSVLDSFYKELAGFATLTYHINPQVDVQIGGRWAHNDQNSLLLDRQNIPVPGASVGESTVPGAAAASKFLYSFAPRWHVTDDLMLYARIATGYEPGGPNAPPPGAPPQIPTQFFPDTTVNYEVGMREQLLDDRLSVDLTAFRIDWSKVQIISTLVSTTNGNSYSYIGNGGTATSQGLEWALALAPLSDLHLSLSGAYIDAKLTSAAPIVGGTAGDRLPLSPQWSSSLDGEYGHRAFADYRAFVGATWSYTGPEVSNYSETGLASVPPTRTAGYATLNVRTGLQNERWHFSLYAKNVTNKHAITLFIRSPIAGFPGFAYFNEPRTIGGTASFQF